MYQGFEIMKRSHLFLTGALCGSILCAVCSAQTNPNNIQSEQKMNTFKQISQDEAAAMMQRNDGHIIVDVRRPDEYASGHIPGAVLIPNETISSQRPEQLKDLNQVILIYCRSGNRSRQAAAKLAALGYTQIYEFGGINTWSGDIVPE